MSAFTDKLINMLAPDEQISSLLEYDDVITEADKAVIAEKVGRPLSGKSGSNGTDGATLSDFQDATYNSFVEGDAQRWIRITGSANGNDGFYHIETFVSSSEVTISPALAASETGLTWQMYREPNLQDDVNLAITQLREIIDPSLDWFQNMPRAFDPTNTDGSNTKNEKMSMKVLADDWYGTKTKIVDIISGTLASGGDTSTGVLFSTAIAYATPANREGLVIQASTANAGSYQDEVALASITIGLHKVILIDPQTGAEFRDASGNLIYGVLQDGADHGGTGDGTDVFIKYVYDNAGTPTAYTFTADDPANIIAHIPRRKRRINMLEYDDRRFLSAGIVGDAEQAADIDNLQAALGLADGDDAGDWDLTNTGNFYPFSELTVSTATMEDIVNKLNEEIGSRDYTEENFITDGQTITESLDALDQALSASGIKSKILERVSSQIQRGTTHTVPFASGSDTGISTYRLDTANNLGLYMDVYVNGKKLIPDSSASAMDGEYEETSNTEVTFRFNIQPGSVIEYIVKDDA